MRTLTIVCASVAVAGIGFSAPDSSQEFTQSIRPVLVQNCAGCHNPTKSSNNFLKATSARDISADRGLWRSVAAQLRNRTMPPVNSKLAEADRLKIAQWVETELRQTACSVGDYAGAGTVRRLNRREYRNTIRDLLGVSLDEAAIFPADGTGGAGFDTNGDTLYIQPMMMERYLQAAQQILDRVIVTPRLSKTFPAASAGASRTLAANEEIAIPVSIYVDGDYDILVSYEPGPSPVKLTLKVDGSAADALAAPRRGGGFGPAQGGAGRGVAGAGAPAGRGRGAAAGVRVRLERGTHSLTLVADAPATVISLNVEERSPEPSAEKRATHHRLLGTEPGEAPLQPRKAAQQALLAFLPKAFRRPVQQPEAGSFLALYDRAAQRGDPYEERVKLALKAVLVSPDFLFRMEERKAQPGIYPLGQFELATRLSYFLWSTMPDEQLFRLADQGRLQDPKVLANQVERMLDDPRARTFTSTFTGQWLGTQEIGGRFMPILTETLSYYTPEIAADLRTQPILLLDRIVGENRSILELLTADYTYLTQRLVKYYQLEDQVKDVNDNEFHLVRLTDSRRAGLLGMAGVLGMTSHYEQTSPVLRGAWVLDTLLGTSVPPPPPGVPPLDSGDKVTSGLTTRERVLQHRADPACATCHRLMDPIGFGLENFDWMGRLRDKEKDGKPIDASGELPSGEKFNGAVELRQVLLKQKDEFARQVAGKVMGYALGRSLQDGDSCTIQKLVDKVASDNYRARTMIREIVLSLPFRNTQGGAVKTAPIEAPKLNISAVTSRTQDAKGHDNAVVLPPKR